MDTINTLSVCMQGIISAGLAHCWSTHSVPAVLLVMAEYL